MSEWIQKYRSNTFADVAGQKNALKSLAKKMGKDWSLPQNILFSSISGTGKTTIGRIIAKTINCQNSNVDKYEGQEYFVPCNDCKSCKTIDSGDSGSNFHYYVGARVNQEVLHDIKRLADSPVMFGKARVIFIDEIQNIASGRKESQQELLGLLEKDYKGKVFFIMSTMEIKKIHKSVVDRFHEHFKLHKVADEDLIMLAQKIMDKEGLLNKVDFNQISYATEGIELFLKEGLSFIASASQGSARRFVGFLESCVERELYSKEDIIRELDIMSEEEAMTVLTSLIKKDPTFFARIEEMSDTLGEFFSLSYSVLVDYLVYYKTGQARFEWQKGRFDYYKKNTVFSEIQKLKNIYDSIHERSESYFRGTYYRSRMIDFFDLPEEPKKLKRVR